MEPTRERHGIEASGYRDPIGTQLGILVPTEEEWRSRTRPGPPEASELVRRAIAGPEIREERVQAIRRAIANGTYSADPAAIADRLLGAMLDRGRR